MAPRTRLPTPAGLALIRRWEGFRAAPYLDSAGVPTIGYGTIRYEDGTAEFPKWCWAGGRRLPGLLRRRDAERALWLVV